MPGVRKCLCGWSFISLVVFSSSSARPTLSTTGPQALCLAFLLFLDFVPELPGEGHLFAEDSLTYVPRPGLLLGAPGFGTHPPGIKQAPPSGDKAGAELSSATTLALFVLWTQDLLRRAG